MELIDKIIELESNPSQSSSNSTSEQSSIMFQTGAFFSCAPVGIQRPVAKVGGVRKSVAASRKTSAVRKTKKGAAKSVKWQPTTVTPPSKPTVVNTTQPAAGRSSRKRHSTSDDSQIIPDAKKPRVTRSSTRNKSKAFGGISVASKPTPVTKAVAVGPKKTKLMTRTRQPKGNTRVKAETVKSAAVRRSSRRTK